RRTVEGQVAETRFAQKRQPVAKFFEHVGGDACIRLVELQTGQRGRSIFDVLSQHFVLAYRSNAHVARAGSQAITVALLANLTAHHTAKPIVRALLLITAVEPVLNLTSQPLPWHRHAPLALLAGFVLLEYNFEAFVAGATQQHLLCRFWQFAPRQ